MNHTLNRNPKVLIDWFDDFGKEPNRYAFLSNFYPAEIRYAGDIYPTSEHAFAAAKVDPACPEFDEIYEDIAAAPGPGAAKSLGRECPLRPDWETVKFEVMRAIVWAKFTQHDDLRTRLLATGDAYLQEGTYWNDRIWGVDLTVRGVHPLDRPGQNWLGTILMETRARLRCASRMGA